jgi:hypothetical protein
MDCIFCQPEVSPDCNEVPAQSAPSYLFGMSGEGGKELELASSCKRLLSASSYFFFPYHHSANIYNFVYSTPIRVFVRSQALIQSQPCGSYQFIATTHTEHHAP